MQNKKLLPVVSLVLAAVLLVGASGNVARPTYAATEAATMSAIPGSGMITGPDSTEAQKLNASGATFPLPLYTQWSKEYKTLTGVEINYAGGGSGKGRQDISAEAVDFAGSDAFMADAELKAAKGGAIVQIASTVGGIVPAYNIPELAGKDPLKFTGDELAKIYLGTITKWNDATLVADNPQLKDVDQDISPVYRSDGSGTTFNFTYYLAAVNKDWASKVKYGTTANWPTGTGDSGNPGVANEIKQTEYTIGYIDQAFATGLQSGVVKNAAGNYVAANADTVSAAATGFDLPADMRIVIGGLSKNPNAYPISTFTWLIVYTNQTDPAKGLAVARFLWWAIHDGQKDGPALGYAPLPAAAVKADEANILKIMINGKQALPTSIATPDAAMASATMAATKQP